MHEINNFVDVMIKSKSSSTLKTTIDINQINLNINEWIEQATTKEIINKMTKKNVQINEWDENFKKDDQKTMIFNFSKRFECWYTQCS
jgi:predicted adenine nucleotide alpha hydrolase (AANH) superfamily ATPase